MRYPHLVRSNLNLLPSLQALVEERSITRAANRMFLSQPAMSRVLDKLQELFDDKLLVRTRNGLEPTRLAQQVYEKLERTLPAIEEVLRGVEFNPKESTDHFRIGMTDHVALTLLPPLMRVISQVAPEIRIEIFAWDENSFRKLETNALDLVIWVNQAPAPLRSSPIYSDRSVCVVRKGHPLGNRRLTAKRYLQLKHLVISLVGAQQGSLEQALNRLGYRRNARLTIPFFTAAAQIIENTDMVATLPHRLAKRFSQNFKTRCVPISIKLPEIRYIQVWHPRNDDDPAHRWLRQLVQNSAAES
jgi:DNA-binding transcriptional LysR family regulator